MQKGSIAARASAHISMNWTFIEEGNSLEKLLYCGKLERELVLVTQKTEK